MKSLIVEDDFTSRLFLQEILKDYGQTHVAVNGKEALDAIAAARAEGEPYDLITLDIMMPEMDGQETLKAIRAQEEEDGILIGDGVKIIMTTALADNKNVMRAFNETCDEYLVKPIDKSRVIELLQDFQLISC